MKTVIETCVLCGQSFEHHAAWEQDTCKKCRRRISNKKASPKYYAKNKESILRKYRENRENRAAYVKPTRGVQVIQPGCSAPDTYSKREFEKWLSKGAFPKETEYWIDHQYYIISELGIDNPPSL